MSVLEVLEKSRELLSDRANWCQRNAAIDKYGNSVNEKSEAACQWCAIGAVGKFSDDGYRGWSDTTRALRDAARALYPDSPRPIDAVIINDEIGYEAVLSLFDKAIEIERAKQ